MKIYKIFYTSLNKLFHKTTGVSHTNVTNQLVSSPIKDNFKSTTSLGTTSKNILQIKKTFWGDYIFTDSGKKVGYTDYSIRTNTYGDKKEFPDKWFIKDGEPDKSGNYPLKPYMYIAELSMNDRINKPQLIKREKKYGAMAMQHLLQIADKNGCINRIALHADTLGKTGFKPGKFYNKMGFSLAPERIKFLEKEETNYNQKFEKLKQNGLTNSEIEKQLKENHMELPQKSNNRYVEETGSMFLTNPECIINYPL